ncbi:B-cell receptor CD22-like isoform X2 [Channa argus]|uniref:B-cell receptor CD22-like isoform X2 n=1 Tax=Channa argus TaxID=215402 RepID=UPI0035214333
MESAAGFLCLLSVSDLQVDNYGSTELWCKSKCSPPNYGSYVWYKNGQEILEQTSAFYSPSDYTTASYSCAFRGHEDFPSRSKCYAGHTCHEVIYSKRNICALKGSSVEISCTYSFYYPESKFWFSPERSRQWQNPSQPEDLRKDSQYSGRVKFIYPKSKHSTLRITDLRETDSAHYHFKFITYRFEWGSSLSGTTLTVTALRVHVTRVSVGYYSTNAVLRCHSSCSPAAQVSYVWFRNGQKIPQEVTSSYKDSFYYQDRISCAVKGFEQHKAPAVYAPKLPSVSVSPSAEIVEGSSVTLTCSSDANPAANYTWYKENGNLNVQHLNNKPQLVFSSIQSSDSGQYYCEAESELGERRSQSFSINVKYAPKTTLISMSSPAKIMEGSSVTLSCSSDANPPAKYVWHKRNQEVHRGPEGIYHLRSISSEDRAMYNCTSVNQFGQNSTSVFIDVQYAPQLPSVSVSPSAEIVEGSSVTLTCSSDANPAAKYTWYKENQTLYEGQQGFYKFTSISPEDSGKYYCRSENQYGKSSLSPVNLDVHYPPKLPSVSVSPSAEIVEGSSVTLTCSSDANPAAKYTWYKENEDSPKTSGQIFPINDFRPEHSGNYYCEAQNTIGRQNSTLHLSVASGSMKSAAAGCITVVILVLIFLLAFLWIRKRKFFKNPLRENPPGERPGKTEQQNVGPEYDTVHREPAEQQQDLLYTSVIFSKIQEDPLYSNIRTAQLKRDEEEDVDYTVVKSSTPSQGSEEDPSELYSTVNKNHRT